MNRLEGGGKVMAFQDDVYVLAKPKHFDAIILNAAWQFIQVGLELKRSKTEYWARFNEPSNVGAEAHGATRTPEPVVLKQALPKGLTGRTQGMTNTMQKAVEKRRKVCSKVRALTEAGMGSHPAMVLLRAAIPADVSFTIRTVLMDYRVQTTLDNLMLETVDSIVGVGELQTCRQQWACLALKDGGLGMMSMNIAAPCAHAASWGEALERIATQIGVHAYPQIGVRAPAVASMIEEAMNMCRTIGVDPEQKIREATTSKQSDLQKQWAAEAQARAKDKLMGELSKVECAILRAAGGKGAGAWLEAHDGERGPVAHGRRVQCGSGSAHGAQHASHHGVHAQDSRRRSLWHSPGGVHGTCTTVHSWPRPQR